MKKDTLAIISRQREEIKEKLKGKIVERELSQKIKKYLEKRLIKVISGVRRSGKSYLALLLLKNKNFGYVNFDEKDLLKVKLDDILSSVIEIYGRVKFLLLDEIQNVKGWELWVNSLQRRGYNLIITGSNAKLLSKELATHLTGRYLEFETYPFSFREFLRFKKFGYENIYSKEVQGEMKKLLREYMKRGGFPEYLVEELDEEYLRTLFNAIIYADVVKRWKIREPVKIWDLGRYLLTIFSREYSATKLKNILGFKSTLTVLNYIKYLEEAFLIFTLERFSFKQKEFMKAPKKVYSVDTGLSNALSVKISEEIGLMMENMVFLELKRRGLRENKDIFYFKDYQGREADFVLKEGLKVRQLIQVTYANARDEIEQREIKSLLKASELLKCKNLLCITWDYEDEQRIKGREIKFLPLWKWLLHVYL